LHTRPRPHVAGVVDFDEFCAGDPGTGLAAAWMLLPADAAVSTPNPVAGTMPPLYCDVDPIAALRQ
jgi:hypothetical protein